MSERYIFHLAFPVSDLAATKEFYVGLLGADVGRENAEWLDILLWGHQITLHQRPDDVLSRERQGKRHFGVILPWSEWQQLVEHLRAREVVFLQRPEILLAGTPQEQAKFYLEDPSNNVIEIKAYRNFTTTFEFREGRSRVEGEGNSLYFYDYDNPLFELHTGTLKQRLAKYHEVTTAQQSG